VFFVYVPHLQLSHPKLVITPAIEGRERIQRRAFKQFQANAKDSSTLLEQRYRVGGDMTYGDNISGHLRYTYAHTYNLTPKGNFATEASDLYIGELDVKTHPGTIMVGRQLLKLGGQRLFEESSFGQRSKSFDLARFKTKQLDIFAGKVGLSPTPFDVARIAGATYDSPLGETLAVFKHDQWLQHEDFWTFDHRYTTTVKGFDIETEGALQRGRYNGKDLQSSFLHGRLTKGFGKHWGSYVEANAVSGGSSGNTSHLFENLYSGAHSFYGRMDMTGPRNMNNLEFAITYKMKPGKEIGISYDRFGLNSEFDGWYGKNGPLNTRKGGSFIDPTGKSGRDIGQEIDLFSHYDVDKRGDFLGVEAGTFLPGRFIRAFTGNNTRTQYWGTVYLQFHL
jgi:hypothetical protein